MPSRPTSGARGASASSSPSSSPSSPPSPSLKTLLKAADTLLKPPDPIPSATPALLRRLRACSKCLPREWRRTTPEWSDEDELDHIGDELTGPAVDAGDEMRRQARRDQLVMIVAKRSFAMVRAVHRWLSREHWPKEQRGGLEQKDFLLGTADLRLIRIMLSWTNPTYLLYLTANYADRLPDIDPAVADALSSMLDSLLELVKPAAPPAPAAGPSSRVSTPPTVVTQTLVSGHLIYIGLAALILAWTPSVPQEKYAKLRATILDVFMSLSPAHAISTLGSMLKLLTQGRMENTKPSQWLRKWPKYPDARVNQLLTLQVRRPGGVRGMMEVMLGESAKTNDGASVDGARLDHIYNLLVRIPHAMTQETYYPWLLAELFAIIPVTDSPPAQPIAYVSTACYCIQRFWTSNAPGVAEWLKIKIHSPWTPSSETWLSSPSDRPVTVTTFEAFMRSLQNIRSLLVHNPDSAGFADFLIGPILVPMFSLYGYLKRCKEAVTISESRPANVNGTATGPTFQDLVISLMHAWGTMVEQDVAIKGVWAILDGKTGWSTMHQVIGSPAFFWEGNETDVRLVAGWPMEQRRDHEPPEIITRATADTAALDHLDLLPKETAENLISLCQLLHSLKRNDVTSEIMLRALDLWRISEASGTASRADVALKFCLTLEIMEQCGPESFSQPKQMLGFIERVLHDHASALVQAKSNNASPLIQEVNDEQWSNRHDADLLDKDTLVKLALQLLESLNLMNGAEQGVFDSKLIHPIVAQLSIIDTLSPFSALRDEVRHAQVILAAHVKSDNSTGHINGNGNGNSEHGGDLGSQMEDYQRALAFASDPEIPVRALGFNILKDLVSAPDFDKSLVDAILDIYLKSLKDSDSFIYLSAVNGLGDMVDVLGKEVFTDLVAVYRGGANIVKEGTIEALDSTLRMGETLDLILKRSGEVLSRCAGDVIPTLMTMYPDDKLSTVLRMSALSLLSTCAETSYLSILPWSEGLTDSLLDLIQIESVPSSPFRPVPSAAVESAPRPGEPGWRPNINRKIQLIDDEPLQAEEEVRGVEAPRIVDEEPISADSKHPALRRAALVLLDWVLRAVATKLWPESVPPLGKDQSEKIDLKIRADTPPVGNRSSEQYISPATLSRAKTILIYVAQTDEDEVVRGHAEAVAAGVEVLQLGLGRGSAVNAGLEGLEGGLRGLMV